MLWFLFCFVLCELKLLVFIYMIVFYLICFTWIHFFLLHFSIIFPFPLSSPSFFLCFSFFFFLLFSTLCFWDRRSAICVGSKRGILGKGGGRRRSDDDDEEEEKKGLGTRKVTVNWATLANSGTHPHAHTHTHAHGFIHIW